MATEILTQEDLKQFRMQLMEDFKGLLENHANPAARQWLKSSEVRKMLGISHGTLQNLRINGSLPYTKLGGIMFYKYGDIEKILEVNSTSKIARRGNLATA